MTPYLGTVPVTLIPPFPGGAGEERPWVDLISSWGAWLFAMGRFVLFMGRFSIGHGAHMANRWGLSPKGEPYQTIGVDFGVAARFTQNNQKKIAGCDTRTSHPATAELRRVRHVNFAPCDFLMLHPATSRYRTLPLPPIAPCDSKSPLSTPKTT